MTRVLFSLALTIFFTAHALASESTNDPDAVRSLIESLDQIQSDPDQVDSIVRRLDRQTEETLSQIEEVEKRIQEIEGRISESQQQQQALRDRMDALEVARELVGVRGTTRLASGEDRIGFNKHIRPILSDKCFTCHGPDEAERKGGLRLDDRESAVAEGKSGHAAVVPGDREGSELWYRITTHEGADRMPPSSQVKQLTEAEIELIGKWIDQGAEYERHWAFVKQERPEVPEVANPGWPKNPIDRFVLARLEEKGIAPSPEADRETLLRRVYLDLIGIPPTPREIEEFLSDDSPDAYDKVVDHLLASPHYGERWARHWLDAARYADSNGYSIDGPREIWKYRDWVIDAFNRDMPFDQFTIEQLAGDLLPNADDAQKTATGFHRNTMINQEGGIDKEEFRIEAVLDRVNTTGTVFLGLTVACVQCHEHKYDPIAHEEYYELFAFFNNDDEVNLQFPTEDQAERVKELNNEIKPIREEWEAYLEEARETTQAEWEKGIAKEDVAKLFLDKQEAILKPRGERSPEEQKIVDDYFRDQDEKSQEFKKRIDQLNGKKPDIASTMVLRQRAEPRVTQLFIQGDFTRKDREIQPGVIDALHEMEPVENPDRLDLAKWIVDPDNPLTARVTVNRFWQRFFGKGIVETEDDFGSQGSLPTHPKLLDWLAVEFIENGWSMKSIHRLIATSATYRQTSHTREDLKEIDPKNEMLARQNRIRLDAEVIRDSALAAAGVLNRKVKGPSVFPPLPDGVMDLGQRRKEWDADEDADRYRRGLYTFFWRATPHSFLMTFDAPNAMETCTRRVRSNTPLQALTLLNDQAFVEMAESLGQRLSERVTGDTEEKIHQAFEWCLCREATEPEIEALTELLEKPAETEAERWNRVARVMLNLDEFVTRE